MGRFPERRAPGTAGGIPARPAGRSRGNRCCREGPGRVRGKGSATAGAAWAGSTHSEQSSGCARVVYYEARETKLSNQVYTVVTSLSAGSLGIQPALRRGGPVKRQNASVRSGGAKAPGTANRSHPLPEPPGAEVSLCSTGQEAGPTWRGFVRMHK